MAKIWTLSSLVAAAMDSKKGEKSVRLGRRRTMTIGGPYVGKRYLRVVVKFHDGNWPDQSGVTADFFYVTEEGASPIPHGQAQNLLKGQKALMPKLSKAQKKADRQIMKAAKKKAAKAVVVVVTGETAPIPDTE